MAVVAAPVVPAAPVRGRRSVDQWVAELPVGVLAAVAAALVGLGVAGVLFGGQAATPVPAGMTITIAAAFTPLGVFLERRLPGNAVGRLMLLIGAAAAAAALATCWSGALPMAWLSQWLWWPPIVTIPVLLLLAPDGRLPSPRWRPLAVVLAATAAATTVSLAGAALARPRTLVSTYDPLPRPPLARQLVLIWQGGFVVVMLATLGVLVALVLRWRAAGPRERHQLACLLPSAVLLVVGITLGATNLVPYAWLAAVVALPLGLTVAVLRYQLHDLDLYIHRGMVWLVLTGLGVAVFAIIATGVGAIVAQPGSPTASLLAAATVAALLQPGQRLTQRAVNRMLYGRRDEPYAVITGLGHHLESLRDPLAVLPQIAATIVESLRVPYAAVLMAADDGSVSTAAESGRRAGTPERFAMVAHGRPVGELLVTPRRAGTRFSGAESQLLRDLAGQAALAAEACRHAMEIQRARDRLVLAREEERRRLRRDLHDGVASALVGSRMLAEAARRSVTGDGPAPQLLETLAADLEGCSAEVRTLIDGLRPASLDDGLATALQHLTPRVPDRTSVSLHLDGDLTELPAAVEVAAYRVVAEALTNVVKHARARTCTVRVRRDECHLDVVVSDDGVGFAERPDDTGVGLSSICGRVEELNGRCSVVSSPAGTCLDVRLPLPLTHAGVAALR